VYGCPFTVYGYGTVHGKRTTVSRTRAVVSYLP
jgi:hypothetical protein